MNLNIANERSNGDIDGVQDIFYFFAKEVEIKAGEVLQASTVPTSMVWDTKLEMIDGCYGLRIPAFMREIE